MVEKKLHKTSGPYRKVVIASDFSSGSRMALKRLVTLPLAQECHVTIVHALPPTTPGVTSALRKFTKEQLTHEADELRRRRGDINVSIAMLEGKAVQEIVAYAKKSKADLLVMGRRGTTNWKDALIGSVTERVVLQTDTSVLVVSKQPHGPYKRPMAAVDEDATVIRVLHAMMAIAPEADEAIIFHAWGLPYESQMRRAGMLQDVIKRERTAWEENMKRQLNEVSASVRNKAGLRVKLVLRRGDARHAVNAHAASFDTDLIVVGSNRRPGFAHLILGSVAQEILRGADRDVLVARRRARRR